MKKENDLKLKNEFPELLNRFSSNGGYVKGFKYIDCMDGWFDLLEEALQKIQLIRDTSKKDIVIRCIKQKFGSLRIYIDYGKAQWSKSKDLWDKILDDIEYQTERESLQICEECSQTGQLTRNKVGWVRTLCLDCINNKIQQGTMNEDLLHTFGYGIK